VYEPLYFIPYHIEVCIEDLLYVPIFSSDKARLHQSDYIFFVDADAHIDDGEVLRELLRLNK